MKCDLTGLTLLKNLTWDEVFEIWRKNEEPNESWRNHWTERGFVSWEEWRQRYAEALRLAESKWKLYRINEPARTIVGFRGGPFKSWAEKYYDGEMMPSFEWLVARPGIRSHPGIRAMADKFGGDEITVIGLQTERGIVIIEGMHRCCAAVLAVNLGHPLLVEFKIALADSRPWQLPVVGGFSAEQT